MDRDAQAVEAEIRGLDPDARSALRHEKYVPAIHALEPVLRAKLETISQRTKLAEAIRYALTLDGTHSYL